MFNSLLEASNSHSLNHKCHWSKTYVVVRISQLNLCFHSFLICDFAFVEWHKSNIHCVINYTVPKNIFSKSAPGGPDAAVWWELVSADLHHQLPPIPPPTSPAPTQGYSTSQPAGEVKRGGNFLLLQTNRGCSLQISAAEPEMLSVSFHTFYFLIKTCQLHYPQCILTAVWFGVSGVLC